MSNPAPTDWLALYLRLPEFALVCARLGALVLVLPFFGSMSIPTNLRVLFVMALALLVTPFVRLERPPADFVALLLALGGEVLLGALLGTTVVACFLGLQLAGMLVAQESGLAFGSIVDPTLDQEETVLGSFYLQFGLVVFLIVGGHRAILSACLDTFTQLPLLSLVDDLPERGVALVLMALAAGGRMAFQVAMPALLTLFLLNVALGLISRTVPQLNVTTLGFSLKSLVGFVIMAVALPTAAVIFTAALEQAQGWMLELTHGRG